MKTKTKQQFEVVHGLAAHMAVMGRILQRAAQFGLDVFISTGSLDTRMTEATFLEHCSSDGRGGLSDLLRDIVDSGGNVRILVGASLPGGAGDAVQVSPGIRDLLLIQPRDGQQERPVKIRSLGFIPRENDGIVHYTIATNDRKTTVPDEKRWFVRVEAFHEPERLDGLRGLYLENTESAASLGAKLLGDFDKLFLAAGKRAAAGNQAGVMRLNGDNSFVRKSAKFSAGIVAPV